MADCAHCPDGHESPWSKSWGVYVSSDRDGDGQPTRLIVAPSDGAHVAESDAEWLRKLITDAEAWRQHLRQRASQGLR
jgi:hypothetical protein